MARKRKPTKREPNGRAQRPAARQAAEAATHVAIAARKRLYGAPEAFLRDAKLGTVIGRLELSGQLGADIIGEARQEWSQRRYETALAYLRLDRAYMKAIDAPEQPSEPRSEDEQPRPCEDCGRTILCDECQARAVERIRAQWGAVTAALISVRYPDLHDAVLMVVRDDQYRDEILEPLRQALDLIADMV